MRRPWGCEDGSSSGEAENGRPVGETSTAESCGLKDGEDVVPYEVGFAWLLEGGVGGVRDEEWAAWYAEFIVNALRERGEGPRQ